MSCFYEGNSKKNGQETAHRHETGVTNIRQQVAQRWFRAVAVVRSRMLPPTTTQATIVSHLASNRLESIRHDPLNTTNRHQEHEPHPDEFAEYLAGIFAVDEADLLHANPPQHTINIPPFTTSELQIALRRLRKHKSADPRGVELEMLYHEPDELLDYVLELYNDLLRTGRLDPSWQHTLFTMLPKKGDRSRPSNWRPIASLKVLYKVFSKMVHARLQHVLDPQQSFDQTGFRQHTGVEHALCVFDNVCARSLEYNCEIWVASIDLRKAFDRIHHPALFRALRHQGVSEGYLQLLQELYSSQTGSVSDSWSSTLRKPESLQPRVKQTLPTLMLTATWFRFSLILKHTCTSDEKSPLIFADARLLKLPTGSTPLGAISTSSGMF